MLERIIAIIYNKKSSWKLLVALLALMLGGKMLFSKPPAKKNAPNLLKEVKLKEVEEFAFKDNTSMYDEFIDEQKNGKAREYNYNPNVRVIQGGGKPFRNLYRVKTREEPKQENIAPAPKKKQVSAATSFKKEAPKEQAWGFSYSNPNISVQENFFKGRLMEKQAIYDGKPIRIKLLEDIPELSLEAGIILVGPATFLGSARIKIHITAAEGEGGKKRRIALDCFDAEDLQEGIYSDALAKQLEEYAKESVVDELLDIDFQGKGLAKKVNNLTRMASKIELAEGKEIYLVLPRKEKK